MAGAVRPGDKSWGGCQGQLVASDVSGGSSYIQAVSRRDQSLIRSPAWGHL